MKTGEWDIPENDPVEMPHSDRNSAAVGQIFTDGVMERRTFGKPQPVCEKPRKGIRSSGVYKFRQRFGL